MTTYRLEIGELSSLSGKTILITGAATGIGRDTALIAHQNGANVIFGDWNRELGEQLEKELKDRVLFRHCDVSDFEQVLELFQAGWKAFGVIHAVLGNAGVNTENFLEDTYSGEKGKERLNPPDLTSLNINLIGQIYVVKCALHYFKKWPQESCQIVLTGSAASFLDTPPLHLYCAAKSGLLGLMRSLRTQLPQRNVTINLVAPWLTVTPMMLPEFRDIWGTLPLNQPEDVANALLLPVLRPAINGKSFFVAGGEIVEFEEKLHEAQPLWMGCQLSLNVDEGQRRLIPELRKDNN